MEALQIEKLSKFFGGVAAVKDITFAVQPGEKLAIIGPNGAGKTTLFNLINGLHKPTSGRICFFGQDITKLPTQSRTHLGMARSFQIISLCPDLTVMVNALLAVEGVRSSLHQLFRPLMAYKTVVSKSQELLEAMDLWEKRDEPVKVLGYGEQRRLEIAISLASEPRMILLDEPSCGLTTAESAEMIAMVRQLGKDITVLLVAHDMDLVFGLATRIIVLQYGEIIADGAPAEIQLNQRVKEIYMGIEKG